mgnify:CR=1 FL=1
MGHGLAVVGVSRCQGQVEQLASVVDHQMQFESEEPIHRSLAPRCQVAKDAMLANAFVVTDLEASRIDETDARTTPEASTQVSAKRNESGGEPFDEALVTHPIWKGARPVLAYLFRVVPLEVPVAFLVKRNQDGQNLAQTHAARTLPRFYVAFQELLLPARFKFSAEIVYFPKQSF